jgi:hypothetical protein
MLRLRALSLDQPERTMRVLTGALLACGGWVLTRTQEGDCRPGLRVCPCSLRGIYAVLIGCGLKLSQDSHLRMAELCHCTKNLIETKAFDIARVDLLVYSSNPSKRSHDESQSALLG